MKSTKLELAQRIQLVKDMLLSYKSFNEIASYLSEKYSLSERQTCIYIKRARDSIEADVRQTGLNSTAYHIETRRKLAEKCDKKQDYKTELAVLRDLAELGGLYPDKNGDSKQGHIINVNLDPQLMTIDIPTELVPLTPISSNDNDDENNDPDNDDSIQDDE